MVRLQCGSCDRCSLGFGLEEKQFLHFREKRHIRNSGYGKDVQRPTWEERKAKQNPKWVSNTVLVVLKISLKIQWSLHNHLCKWDHCYYFEGEKSVKQLFPWGLGLTWYSLKRQWGRITDSWAEMHFCVCVQDSGFQEECPWPKLVCSV